MIALRIEYLTGRSVATAYNDRRESEWPPHPARVYSALVAAWADADEPSADERAALDWLAAQPPPSIAAGDATRRDVVPHFVPVNDAGVVDDSAAQRAKVADAETAVEGASSPRAAEAARKKLTAAITELASASVRSVGPVINASASQAAAAEAVLPWGRKRQERFFPSVTPADPVVHLVWESTPPVEHGNALDALALRVARIGHSSSLVTCRVVAATPAPTLVPSEDGALVLRAAGPGQLGQLEAAFDLHREVEPRVLPARFVRYDAPERGGAHAPSSSVLHGDWIVLRRVSGPRLPSTRAEDVAEAVRGALMEHAVQPPDPYLSGHEPGGGRIQRPHLAILPLPFVGHPQADGAILGVALVLPRDLPTESRRSILAALDRWEARVRRDPREGVPEDADEVDLPVCIGRQICVRMVRVAWGDPPQASLRAETWGRPSRCWASVSPVALDRNPGNLGSGVATVAARARAEAEASLVRACVHIGLPEPTEVKVQPGAPVRGAVPVREWPPFPRREGRIRRVKVHALLTFAEPVAGPIVLGAGRYHGLGLFRPIDGD